MSTVRLPLFYCEQSCGFALIDAGMEYLSELGKFSVRIPRNLRAIASKRPDVILASLTEDKLAFQACVPFITKLGTQVHLAHLVVRPELFEAITLPDEASFNRVRRGINSIVHVNNNKTDCRLENIRELSSEPANH